MSSHFQLNLGSVAASRVFGLKLRVLIQLVKDVDPDCYVELGAHKLFTFREVASVMSSKASLVAVDLYEQAPAHESAPQDLPLSVSEAEKILANLSQIQKRILKADTRTLKPVDLGELQSSDRPFVFIDGGHSLETGVSDFKLVTSSLKLGSKATIVIDDLGLDGTDATVPVALEWVSRQFGGEILVSHNMRDQGKWLPPEQSIAVVSGCKTARDIMAKYEAKFQLLIVRCEKVTLKPKFL